MDDEARPLCAQKRYLIVMDMNPENGIFPYLFIEHLESFDFAAASTFEFFERDVAPDLAVMLSDVDLVLERSLSIFRGVYPGDEPYMWRETSALPWLKTYWGEDMEADFPGPIAEEVAQILDEFGYGQQGFEHTHFPIRTYESKRLSSEPRRRAQGLVVETLLAADNLVALVARNEVFKATHWLATVFKLHLEVIQQTLPLVERSNNARLSAGVRHAENRAMKAEVFAWLDTNMSQFKTMDLAADAIAGKLAPIAWRTARSWVGNWKRLRSASRT